jgi:hypothetical protein
VDFRGLRVQDRDGAPVHSEVLRQEIQNLVESLSQIHGQMDCRSDLVKARYLLRLSAGKGRFHLSGSSQEGISKMYDERLQKCRWICNDYFQISS